MPTYIIVANATAARVFRRDRWSRVTEFERFVFPVRKPHDGGDGDGQDTGFTKVSPRGNEISFVERGEAHPATQLAAYLRYARHCGEASSFIVVASPTLLEQLHRMLDRETGKIVIQLIAEELIEASADEIVDRFQPKRRRRRAGRWHWGQREVEQRSVTGGGELPD